ncbi:MAG: flavin-dependent oxidoreductase [Xanthobacteraceae bacterium]|nr:flavin-dependent oxidoreductase [Xanthobacteraceae bacterium]
MSKGQPVQVIIVGAGIGGCALALALHKVGVPCRLVEAAPELKPLGVGINLLPHAVRDLASLGLEPQLAGKGVPTREYCFYTRLGQLVYREPRGRFAGYDWPQISIHRGDLHGVLLDAVRERLGSDAIAHGHKCVGIEQDANGAIVHLADPAGARLPDIRGTVAISCDGVHSVLRASMHPNEAVPRYEGTTQYRGVTRWKPFLTGASMAYLGTHETGKLVIYPIRDNIDAEGRQLVNWVIEVVRPNDQLLRDWNRKSRVEEFIDHFRHCAFDWLDIPALLRANDAVYEYPMMDQEPLPYWTQGRITLLGDAAHPMMPRGSNGAAQAIIDATTLAGLLAAQADPLAALKEYEAKRLKATANVVLANRGISPDAIIRVVEERTKGKPFKNIEDVISREELVQWQERYREIAGFAARDLKKPGALA